MLEALPGPEPDLPGKAVEDLLIEDAHGGRRRRHATVGLTVSPRPAVVLTVGTFLAGRIHVGEANHSLAAAPATRLPPALARRGCATCRIRTGRLKTGTPPRLDGRTHRLLDRLTGAAR